MLRTLAASAANQWRFASRLPIAMDRHLRSLWCESMSYMIMRLYYVWMVRGVVIMDMTSATKELAWATCRPSRLAWNVIQLCLFDSARICIAPCISCLTNSESPAEACD